MNSLFTGKRVAIIVGLGVAAYTLFFCWICRLKFLYDGYSDFDLAVHAQSVWNITRGSLDSSILGIPFLGNHMVLILFLIAPLYLLFPSPLLLLYLQAFALAMGGHGVFLLARRELGEKWAVAMAFAYWVYPPLIYLNLYEFHPVALAVCFLLYALYFYRTERFAPFLLFLGLAVLCQENIALIACAFAAVPLFQKRPRRWIAVPLLLGIAFFAVAVLLVMPRLNPRIIQFGQLYAHLGSSPADMIVRAVTHPIRFLQMAFHPDKLAFFSALLAPVGYLGLLDPLSFVPAIPALLQRLLSDRFTETRILFHYQAEFIPFIFAAAIVGVRRLLNARVNWLRLVPALVLLVFPLLTLWSSDIPLRLKVAVELPSARPLFLHRQAAVLRQIAPDARVLATFRFLPKLANRPGLYSLHHVSMGAYTLSTVPYPPPRDLDYVLLDVADPLTFLSGGFYSPESYKNLQALFTSGRWEVLDNTETFLALRCTHSTNAVPPDLVRFLDRDVPMNTRVRQFGDTSLRLAGFDLGQPAPDNTVPIEFYWVKTAEDPRDYDMGVVIEDGVPLYVGRLSPGNRIWPTQSWPVTTNAPASGVPRFIADQHRVILKGTPYLTTNASVQVELLPAR